MVNYFCHCMFLYVCPVKFFILDSRLANFECGAVAFSASFFPIGVLDGRC